MKFFEAPPEPENLKSFLVNAHALKGASASIGAAELSRKAWALEDAGEREDMEAIRGNLEDFRESLVSTVARIRAALVSEKDAEDMSKIEGEADGETKYEGSEEAELKIIPLLTELKDYIESGWLENIGAINAAANKLSEARLMGEAREALLTILDHVLMTDFDDALPALNELIEKLGACRPAIL
jgi:chemotaxis protein histidine kinase CheA